MVCERSVFSSFDWATLSLLPEVRSRRAAGTFGSALLFGLSLVSPCPWVQFESGRGAWRSLVACPEDREDRNDLRKRNRGLAQFGSALPWGGRGRTFESCS